MKNLFAALALLLFPVAAMAAQQSGPAKFPSQGILGVATLDASTTFSLITSNGVTARGVMHGTTSTLTYSDRTTGSLHLTSNSGAAATGTVTWDGISGSLSLSAVPAAAPFLGSVSVSNSPGCVSIAWIARDDGAVSSTLDLGGELRAFRRVPGSPAPAGTVAYTLVDQDGVNILANLAGTYTQGTVIESFNTQASSGWNRSVNGPHLFTVRGAGARAQGTCRLFFAPR